MSTEGSTRETPLQQKRLADALYVRSCLKEEMGQLEGLLSDVLAHKKVLLDILGLHRNADAMLDAYRPPHYITPCSLIRDVPVFAGEPPYLLAVYSLGYLPPPTMKGFYNFKNIYPVDYECKRIYRRHGGKEAGESDLIFYTCAIRNFGNRPILEITTDAGMHIKGRASEAFELLKRSFEFDIEFSSMVDFMGLNHPEIKKLIHEGCWNKKRELPPERVSE
jgi:hypothetical protein